MNPVAVVTGAARGIGAATVDRLVADDWRVVAVDVCADDPDLDYRLATAAELDDLRRRHGPKVHPMIGDVRSQSDMDAAVAAAVGEFGGLTAAVGVAGVLSGGPPLWEISDERWNVQFDVNVGGIRHLATAAVPVLLEAPKPRPGRVVAVASADLAGTGITANAVCPGSTRGPLLDASAAVYQLTSAEEFARQQLIERLLEPDEPAAMVAWLCGSGASGVTGAALSVDGGLTTS